MALLSPRLRAQIVKEFLSLLRDPRTRFILIVPPFLQLLVFAFAATLEVRDVRIAVVDHDGGRWATELVQRLAATELVGELTAVQGTAQVQALIDRQQVIAALDIPATFSRDIETGRPAVALLVLDGRRANAAQVTQGYLASIATTLSADITGQQGQSLAEVRHWFNPNLNYRWFVVPGLAGTLTTFIALLVTALSIARERELGTFDQLLVSPCTPTEIIVAKTMPGVAIGMFLGTLMVSAAHLLFGIPLLGSLAMLALALLLFVLAIVGVGLMISSVCRTQQQAILGTFAVGVPMILMSGFATPVENMPALLQVLAQTLPLKHLLVLLQGSFAKALPPTGMLTHLWPLAVIAFVTLSGATLLVRGRLQ